MSGGRHNWVSPYHGRQAPTWFVLSYWTLLVVLGLLVLSGSASGACPATCELQDVVYAVDRLGAMLLVGGSLAAAFGVAAVTFLLWRR